MAQATCLKSGVLSPLRATDLKQLRRFSKPCSIPLLPVSSRQRRASQVPHAAQHSEQLSSEHVPKSSDTPHPSKPLQSASRFERLMPEKDILQKAEEEMSEKCMMMEGDGAYDCWQTVFDFEEQKAQAEKECVLAAPGEKQQACGPLESLQTLVREGSAEGVSAVLANIRAASQSRKARKAKDAASQPEPVSGAAKQTESDRAEFEISGGRSAVAMAGGGDPRSESNSEEWENSAAEAAAEGMEDRMKRDASAEADDEFSAVRRAMKKRGLDAKWLHVHNV